MKQIYGCWMHLSEEDNKRLIPIIRKLSEQFNKGDTFPPHISVNDAALMEFDDVKKVADFSIKGIKKFKVEKDSIQFSDKWSKTLYIQIKDNPNLTKISHRLNKTFRKDKPPYALNPHISLLYKEGIGPLVKRKLADSLTLPDKYTVASVAVVTPGNKNYWRDCGKWKIVYEKELK